jgi:hypothetical protein
MFAPNHCAHQASHFVSATLKYGRGAAHEGDWGHVSGEG